MKIHLPKSGEKDSGSEKHVQHGLDAVLTRASRHARKSSRRHEHAPVSRSARKLAELQQARTAFFNRFQQSRQSYATICSVMRVFSQTGTTVMEDWCAINAQIKEIADFIAAHCQPDQQTPGHDERDMALNLRRLERMLNALEAKQQSAEQRISASGKNTDSIDLDCFRRDLARDLPLWKKSVADFTRDTEELYALVQARTASPGLTTMHARRLLSAKVTELKTNIDELVAHMHQEAVLDE
ncbi:MAG: hypothetical protein ACRYGK_12370, partial [Janthinobacterium lividum]